MGAWSKEVFAKNLNYQMDRMGIDQKELAEVVGVSPAAVSDWTKAKKYPRIDKIEIMAEYFRILKSDLIEEKTEEHREMQKKNDAMTGIVIRMQTDSNFYSLVEKLNNLDEKQILGVSQMLSTFIK